VTEVLFLGPAVLTATSKPSGIGLWIENWPSALRGFFDPVGVRNLLIGWHAVVLGEGDHVPAVSTESLGDCFASGRRSRKNLSGCSGCDTDRVLDLVAGQAEFLGNRIDGLSRAEQVDHVVNRRAAVDEPWPPELVVRVNGHF
jgi:hypothetical protein